MPLKDQDKSAWGWAEHVDLKSITQEHILSAYRVKYNFCKNKTCRRNCRGNPYCLSGLGETRLVESLNSSPSDEISLICLKKRDEGTFAGLKNLGATCYVNSLLQLWFHNKAFRDAILSWNPYDDPEEQKNSSLCSDEIFIPQTAVGHLQQLFAEMLYSKNRYIDPTPLVTSLRLDTCTQQDAQEFSKLLVSLIENTLGHQKQINVRHFISDHFKGEYMYVTRCCKCQKESVSPSMFHELELNVQNNHTLTECLAEFLREEKLEGAECYSCAICHSKQEALRFIQLKALPRILNLQLLRFVYDREKGQRKKVKTLVQFPETIDMREFLKSDQETPILYNLSAVLSHKGTKASSGHFIAYIKDGVSGAWNMFNDEAVVKLEGKKLKLDEEDPEGAKKAKGYKLTKGFLGSTDAYMLVYVAENHKPSLEEVSLSEHLQSFVNERISYFDTLWADIEANKEQSREKQVAMLEKYNELSVDDTCGLEEMEVLATDWIVSWLKATELQPINNTQLMCPHNLLDPAAILSAKYVSSSASQSLYDEFGGGPRLRVAEVLCRTCVTNMCSILRTKAQTLEESKEIAKLLKRRMSIDEPGFFVDKRWLKVWRTRVLNSLEGKSNSNILCSNDGPSEQANEECNSISQTSSTVSVEVPESKNNGIASEKLCANSVSKPNIRSIMYQNALRKRRSCNRSMPLNEIRECYVLCRKLELQLKNPQQNALLGSKSTENLEDSNDDKSLNLCRKLSVKLRRLSESSRHKIPLKNLTRSFVTREALNSNELIDSAISHESTDGKLNGKRSCENGENLCENGGHMPRKNEEGNKFEDVEDSVTVFNEGIMCRHGNLSIHEIHRKLVPVRVWEILTQYYPSAPKFPQNSEPCRLCQNESSEGEIAKQQLGEVATIQKRDLIDFLNLRNRPEIGKTSGAIYIVDRQNFYQPWSFFIRSMTKKDGVGLVEPPQSLNIDCLFCPHGLLLYSPWHDDDNKRLVLVTAQEWETLISNYTTDKQVVIPSPQHLQTDPELCMECFEARLEMQQQELLNYERAKIHIRQVSSVSSVLSANSSEDQESQDSETHASKKPRLEGSTSPVPPELKRVMKNLANGAKVGAGDVRRSARNRQRGSGKDHTFTVASSITLRDLKLMIFNRLSVAPFDQHLFTLEGKELLCDLETLSNLRILPGTVLYLQVDEFEDNSEGCSAVTEPETGFKGTGLLHSY